MYLRCIDDIGCLYRTYSGAQLGGTTYPGAGLGRHDLPWSWSWAARLTLELVLGGTTYPGAGLGRHGTTLVDEEEDDAERRVLQQSVQRHAVLVHQFADARPAAHAPHKHKNVVTLFNPQP